MDSKELDLEEVKSARAEEVQLVKSKPVYEERDVAECWTVKGRGPTSTKWVERLKDGKVQSGWVARDFKPKGDDGREDLFAAMPPLEAKKFRFNMACMRVKGLNTRSGRSMKLLIVDVRKAHLNGKCESDEYVERPAEARAGEGKCGNLVTRLHGMRGAAHGWETDYESNQKDAGFKQGRSSTATFFNKDTETRLVVHRDDFTFLVYEDELDKIEDLMTGWYDIKVRGRLGDCKGDVKEVTILKRVLRWDGQRLVLEADPKHRKNILSKMQLEEGSKTFVSPAEREDEQNDGDQVLGAAEARSAGVWE